MAIYRETVCTHYIALGECKKGRDADHAHYCQKCGKYYPRAKVKHVNKKRDKLQRLKKREALSTIRGWGR